MHCSSNRIKSAHKGRLLSCPADFFEQTKVMSTCRQEIRTMLFETKSFAWLLERRSAKLSMESILHMNRTGKVDFRVQISPCQANSVHRQDNTKLECIYFLIKQAVILFEDTKQSSNEKSCCKLRWLCFVRRPNGNDWVTGVEYLATTNWSGRDHWKGRS